MRLFLILILYTCAHGAVFSQTTIKGTVTGPGNQPVPGANILLEGTYDGTSSDVAGKFSFETSETGERKLVIRFVGYKPITKPILIQGGEIDVRIVLQEEINQLEAVTISAGSFTASDASRRTVFRAVDIATTAGATADIAGALNTLPGTQKVGETGRLFVRGGDGNETKTFIDGMIVLDAYGPAAPNTPSRGRFLPFMFKGTSFSTGGYSAEYGQALSSALVLDSKDESEITRTDIGLLSVGGDVAHTQSWDRGSVAGKIQYTNLRPYTSLINQEIDWKDAPASVEAVTAFRQRVGKSGMIKFYGNLNQSDFSLFHHDIDDFSSSALFKLRNSYKYMNASYRTPIHADWTVRSGLSYTGIKNVIRIEQSHGDEDEQGYHAKTVLEGSLSPSIELKVGAEVIRREYKRTFIESPGEIRSQDFLESMTGMFIESDVYLSNKFVTRVGGRLEHNTLTDNVGFDPRLSLAYKIHKEGQISFAYGTFRQTAANAFVRTHPELESEKASHYILNYQRTKNNKTFRIETFYKGYADLVKLSDGGGPESSGSGYAKGLELFWRDNRSVKNLDYWISYSFLDTERDYLDFPVKATPSFASRHNFSIVTKYFVKSLKSQLGTTYSYTSGRPYHDPNREAFNDGKTPSYQDLSFNWSYLAKPYLIVFFSCTNVTGRDNVFGYEYSNRRNEEGVYNGRAIRQPAPRFLFLGIFLTLSKDKSMNQLPSL
jgi:hypothetical protein